MGCCFSPILLQNKWGRRGLSLFWGDGMRIYGFSITRRKNYVCSIYKSRVFCEKNI